MVMRHSDLARLKKPYPETLEPSDVDAMAALGLKLPGWTSLEIEVFADFSEQSPYGIVGGRLIRARDVGFSSPISFIAASRA